MNECIFCKPEEDRIIASTDLIVVMRDKFPVSKFHTLFFPKRHIISYFDYSVEEVLDLRLVMKQQKELIEKSDSSVTGFNVGINIGKDAGQTIFHSHVHLIPRREGDVIDARGGVRGVIPSKQRY